MRPLTYDNLLQIPDDGKRREVLGGELIVNPAPRRDHQEVVANLDWIPRRFFRASGLGRAYTHPVDVHLGRNDIVQPDLLAIREDRLNIYRPEGIVKGPPDLVNEILSPSTRAIDRVRKMALYARSGVGEYWVVDPEERMIAIMTLEGEDYRAVDHHAEGWIASSVFPGPRIDPAEVFTGLD